ncbi:DUF1512 family protein [Candidatus Lokiarchaeum ossiferum]|uniref:DUF1512 family protein n=1 Tax=Candidatus Lokiarchaeum ossiferum TaxID=2951803 RepID=UPI00352DBA6F
MVDILGSIADFLISFFVILLLLVFFYGQNWQGWYASKQIKRAVNDLAVWRDYGIELIKKSIDPYRSESITNREIEVFIREMLDFFVLSPSTIEPHIYQKMHFLMSRREERFHQLIKKFLPNIDDLSLTKITSLLNTTIELDSLCKNVRHNLIVGEKTKSYLFLLQTASEISQTMLTAKAYVRALDSFMGTSPIGDSIGPLAVKNFVLDNITKKYPSGDELEQDFKFNDIIFEEIMFKSRNCICGRPIGPESRVGKPGDALESLLNKLNSENRQIALIITIDAFLRLEGEKSGTVAQGLGVAIGAGKNTNIDKFQIESIALKQNPSIPLEAIVCRESIVEAVQPMTEEILGAVPKIVRLLKQIIRSQTEPQDNIIILGIGNAIGISLRD